MFSPHSFSLCSNSSLFNWPFTFQNCSLNTFTYVRPAYSFDVHHVHFLYKSKDYCSVTQASALSEIVPQRQKFVQVSHIFSFRCRRSDPPNCDTHSESKVDSPSNMYLSTLRHLVNGGHTQKMGQCRNRTGFSSKFMIFIHIFGLKMSQIPLNAC